MAVLPAIALSGYQDPNYPQVGTGLPGDSCVILCSAPPSANVLPERGLPAGCIMFCDESGGWSISPG
ncbi:hypothetical protein [Nocardia sp. NBC_00511]|uniref:hypothetical protein n=1 Tax=Nocardia sp. NBC_00511 TaxID=2903591 RepID=UPI0030DF0015